MPLNHGTENEDPHYSSSISVSHAERNVAVPAGETSPLLADTEGASPSPQASEMPLRRRVLLIGTMASAGWLNRFMVQVTVIMLPSIGKSFSIPQSRQQMVFSTYSVASGSSMLLWGRMADVHGRWGVFLMGASTLAIFTFVLPFSPSEPWLYVFRVLEGFSSAATVPSGIGIISATFPPGKERNAAFVALTASASLGNVLGNIFGGAVGGLLSWRWSFWISAVMAAIVTSSAYRLYSSQSSTSSSCNLARDIQDQKSVDYTGGALVFTSLALLQVGLSQGNVDGWTALYVPGLVCASIVMGYIFVILQLRLEVTDQNPLVRLSMFRNAGLSAAFALAACFFGSYNGFLVFASMYFQNVENLTMLETTYRFLPAGIIGVLSCFFVAPALSKLRGFHLLSFGIACGIISPVLFAFPVASDGASFSYWARGFPAMCLCLSPDFVWPVIGLYVSRAVAESDQSLAYALLQASNNVGRGLVLALATTAQVVAMSIDSQEPAGESLSRGLQAAQWTNVGMSALSLVLTWTFFRDLGCA